MSIIPRIMLKTLVYLAISAALLIWAIIATKYALDNKDKNHSCNIALDAANGGLDRCLRFCGYKGNWSDGQVDNITNTLNNLLNTQNSIVCADPSTDYLKLADCAANALAQQVSYWQVTDTGNYTSMVFLMSKALDNCVSSVPGCKMGQK